MTTTETALLTHVREVARLREATKMIRADLVSRTTEFNAANREILDAEVAATSRLQEAETQLRGAAEAHYRATGEKAPAPGVTIKLMTDLDYPDADALAWAKQTGMALVPETFDRKALEKIAKATPLPFVTITERPVATLAKDLDAALSAVEAQ